MAAHPVLVFPEPPLVLDLTSAASSMVVEGSWWVGRYDEDRTQLYDTDLFTGDGRTVHMGLDLGGPVGTPVHACADGVLFAAGYNAAPGDYGCTLVLEHRFGDERVWMLLGHLSNASIQRQSLGASVRRGEVVGWLGDRHENGDWPPHVHVQVSRSAPISYDMPGAVHPRDRAAARRQYPDPQHYLGRFYPVASRPSATTTEPM